MIVVSDTTAITNLHQIDLLYILKDLSFHRYALKDKTPCFLSSPHRTFSPARFFSIN